MSWLLCRILPTILALTLAGAVHAPVTGQDPPAAAGKAAAGPPQEPLDETNAAALERLAVLLEERRAARAAAAQQGNTTLVGQLDTEIRQLGWQFAGLAARVDVQAFEAPTEQPFQAAVEIEQLVRPLLQALKDATKVPRQVADLEARLEVVQQRRQVAEAAARSTTRTRDSLPATAAARAEAQRELDQRWTPLLRRLRDEALVLQAGLVNLRAEQQPLWTRVGGQIGRFLRNSGTSLLLGAATFAVVFFALHWLLDRLMHRWMGRGLSLRLAEVVLRAFAILAAVAAALVVPYARNDWFLLAIGIVFLVGVGWVVARTAPQFLEQFRLMLNIGAVREGERLLLDGLPYRVAALRFYSRLENPMLEGGVLRVPLHMLVGRRSRSEGPGEPWFPSRVGDVVQLADGVVGPVRHQTPEVVVVEYYGALRSYPTAEFLRLAPRNLSQGFVVDVPLRIALHHARDATDRLPAMLADALRTGLASALPSGQVRGIEVQFQAASPLGLELLALVSCDGAAAPRYLELRRLIARLLVAGCLGCGVSLPQASLAAAAE